MSVLVMGEGWGGWSGVGEGECGYARGERNEESDGEKMRTA